MLRSRVHGVFVLALLLAPVGAGAVTRPPVPLSRATGAFTIPASWAGIWSAVDTARSCDGRSVEVGFTSLDTLCSGGAFGPDTIQNQCSGTFTDLGFDITCTGHVAISETCASDYTEHLQGSRDGDVATTVSTVTTTYTPTLCSDLPDDCSLTTGTLTRTAPAPSDCATTPTRASTWGQLKQRYR